MPGKWKPVFLHDKILLPEFLDLHELELLFNITHDERRKGQHAAMSDLLLFDYGSLSFLKAETSFYKAEKYYIIIGPLSE